MATSHGEDEMTTTQDLVHQLEAGITAAQGVIDNWESGDLAGAVNLLEEWTGEARTILTEKSDGVRLYSVLLQYPDFLANHIGTPAEVFYTSVEARDPVEAWRTA